MLHYVFFDGLVFPSKLDQTVGEAAPIAFATAAILKEVCLALIFLEEAYVSYLQHSFLIRWLSLGVVQLFGIIAVSGDQILDLKIPLS